MRQLLWTIVSGGAFFGALLHPVFAASTPAAASFASSTVSGYRISDVSWQLAPGTIDRLGGVSFRLDAPARTVTAAVGGSSAECSVAGTQARCSFADAPRIDSARRLEVTALS